MEEAAEKVNEGIQARLLDVRRDAVLPEAPLDPDNLVPGSHWKRREGAFSYVNCFMSCSTINLEI